MYTRGGYTICNPGMESKVNVCITNRRLMSVYACFHCFCEEMMLLIKAYYLYLFYIIYIFLFIIILRIYNL